jgi:phosphatidylserine decarboxylase
VYAGEINPPGSRGGVVRSITEGVGTEFAKGAELGRFNMGSTVVLLIGNPAVRFASQFEPAVAVRMGQALAHAG